MEYPPKRGGINEISYIPFSLSTIFGSISILLWDSSIYKDTSELNLAPPLLTSFPYLSKHLIVYLYTIETSVSFSNG